MKKRKNQRTNKKRILWGGGVLSLWMIVGILYSFPNIEQYQSFGAVVYDSEDEVIGYVIHRYDAQKNATRKEYYDSQGDLIKYQSFEYEGRGLLSHRSDYDSKSELLLKVSFFNKNGLLNQKRMEQKDKELEIQYSYVYDREKKRVLSRLSQLGKNNGFESAQNFSDKVTYQYLPMGKRIERYKRNGQGADYQITSAELYCYRGEGTEQLESILNLDSDLRPYKYIQYMYQNGKIKEVRVHQIQNQYFAWRGDCQNQTFSEQALVLKNRFVYAYDLMPFQSFREKQLEYTSPFPNEELQISNPAYALEEDLALTKERVEFYSAELRDADEKIDALSKELQSLKDRFLCPAGETWLEEARECEAVEWIIEDKAEAERSDYTNTIFSSES